VDYQIDFADSAGHLNTAGARKITEYLGDYISRRFGIPDRRGEAAYADWERDHRLYTLKKNEELQAQRDLYRYLMLLERDAADAALFVRDTALFRDPIAQELLEALGVEKKALKENTTLLLIRNGGERSAALERLPGAGETVETGAGLLSGGEALSLDGMSLGESPADADLRITVLRGGEVVDTADFSYTFDDDRSVISQYGANHIFPDSAEK